MRICEWHTLNGCQLCYINFLLERPCTRISTAGIHRGHALITVTNFLKSVFNTDWVFSALLHCQEIIQL